jgi:hypothetical protein
MKMFSETLVAIYEITRYHIPEDLSPKCEDNHTKRKGRTEEHIGIEEWRSKKIRIIFFVGYLTMLSISRLISIGWQDD